ncbi:sigma-70 family RNA polymerase sigma factor [bacterium]|nr:sigma-70 family RNA polymerase sigma factor [bacterium]
MTRTETSRVIEDTFRAEAGRVLATLISGLDGDFELAEDGLQDALVMALQRWPQDGTPHNPAAWITTTARNKIIDRLRRNRTLARKTEQLVHEVRLQQQSESEAEMDNIPDERLKLIFTCCHPALSIEAQIALTLRTLGGLSTNEIAAAFMTPVPTMAQRLVRAKQKIRSAGIPFRVPPSSLIHERLATVSTILYLIFNAGYTAVEGESLLRTDLCSEAIHLTEVLAMLLTENNALQEDPEVLGLLALMLLHDARRDARVNDAGQIILLEAQDRTQWNRSQIAAGMGILERALALGHPGPYQIQAAISALHAEAPSSAQTDWRQIALLYAALYEMQPSPVVELNRAVAIAMAYGPRRGLALLDAAELIDALSGYYLFHAARADLLRRDGQRSPAADAYRRALSLTQNVVERQYLSQRLKEVSG